LDAGDREMIAKAVSHARAVGVAESEIEGITAKELAHVDAFTAPVLAGKLYSRARLVRLARERPSSEPSESPVLRRREIDPW
jgi:hypothetical protein